MTTARWTVTDRRGERSCSRATWPRIRGFGESRPGAGTGRGRPGRGHGSHVPAAGTHDPDNDRAGRLPGRRAPGSVRAGPGQHPLQTWARRRREGHGSFVNVVMTPRAGRREWAGLAVLAL